MNGPEKVKVSRGLLEQYSLRVLRTVAKQQLPKPVPDSNQIVRRKVWAHYRRFLHSAPKEELIGALLPYMNSNAQRLLEEISVWVELHPRKHKAGEKRLEYNKRYSREVTWPRRKLVIQWMKDHSEEVSKICNKNIPMSSGTS